MGKWIALFLWIGYAPLPAQVENKSIRPLNPAHKVALVIGNSNYAYVPKIPPAVNDAADMAAALRKLGFDVEIKNDLAGEALVEAVGRFSRGKVQAGDVAFVYYSGHGGQVAGENYLLPVDYRPPSDDDLVDRRAYKMSLVRDALERTGASVRVLIFDACRDSPVTTSKSATTGLHGISGKAEGTLIAYASADNQVARYETGQRNSFYTAELVSALNQGAGDLKTVLEQVQQRVFQKTRRQQTPYLYGFLSAPLYLGATPAAAISSPLVDLDVERYAAVKDSHDPAQLEEVAATLGRADLAEILRQRARALRSATAALPPVDTAELRKQADAAYDREDYKHAAEAYGPLADRGDGWSMNRLGYLHEKGLGVARDEKKAANLYLRAAETGLSYAMFNIGWQYESGRGVAKDPRKAAEWYRKASDAGDRKAMTNLGNLYETGRGVPLDLGQMFAWHLKGAQAGDLFGMYNTGRDYEYAMGVAKDLEQAVFWYKKAAADGVDDAKKALARLGR